jgi:hypothetical protein
MCRCGSRAHHELRYQGCPLGLPDLVLVESCSSASTKARSDKISRKRAPEKNSAPVVEECDIIREVPEGVVEDDPEGNFNEFGAPDPNGLPIEVVFAENIVAVEEVLPAVNVEIWEEIEMKEPLANEFDRRGNAINNTMIPNFKGRDCGHQNLPTGVKEKNRPLGFFMLFFCNIVVSTFVASTNAYATASKKKKWVTLNPKTFMSFIAVILFMGYVKLPARPMYWSKSELGQPFPQRMISARRFESILSCLHWRYVPEVEKAAAKLADPFWSVAGFVEQLAENSRKYWILDQFMDIDEMSIYFKGKHKCRCYNPNKPEKWHFKAFCQTQRRKKKRR